MFPKKLSKKHKFKISETNHLTKRVAFYSFIMSTLSKSGAQARVYSNLRAYINSDVQLVGLQFPTGLRTRIVESFFRGLPVLTTVQGSDGLYGIKDDENLMIAKSASDFANKITLFIEDESNK